MIISNVQHQSQTHLGKLTPHADQKRFTSLFAIREGNAPSGWATIEDAKHGIAFGVSGEKSILYKEHADSQGKPHDVTYNGLKLREMVVEREHSEKKERIEGAISSARVQGLERKVAKEGVGTAFTSELETTRVASTATPEELNEVFGTREEVESVEPRAPKKAAKVHWKTAQRLAREAKAAQPA